FTNRWIDLPPRELHRIERNLSLLEGLGLRPVREGATIAVSREDEEYTASNLKVSGKGPLIVIHPGTSTYGAYKRWPATSYAQLGDRLVEEFNARVVFTWGPAELERTREIISAMRHPGYLAPEAETLGKLASLIRRADLFISGDTGPMNIASILGVPQVAIFGPKDPAIYGPYHKKALVVRKEVDCSPCTKKTCDDPICITSSAPEEVFEAAKAVLR
ncbi:MAG TPA: glycosyltransferase family 9 protein, partial [Candidatus Tripitaka californicus]|uniref:glycosyltransferase family 9 protein n=1 Tax=Candidatus Tripitaka californicus TaxID=3367616 RepID=UPI0040274CAF